MRNRLCYAWFGELAEALTEGSGAAAAASQKIAPLPEPKLRAVISHDGRAWSVKHEALAPNPPQPGIQEPRDAA